MLSRIAVRYGLFFVEDVMCVDIRVWPHFLLLGYTLGTGAMAISAEQRILSLTQKPQYSLRKESQLENLICAYFLVHLPHM